MSSPVRPFDMTVDQLIEMNDADRRWVVSQMTANQLAQLFTGIGLHPLHFSRVLDTVKVAGGWFTPCAGGRFSYARRRADFEGEIVARIGLLADRRQRNVAAVREQAEVDYWNARGITTGVCWVPAEFA